MSKNTIKDIAAELVKKHSLSPIQADKFVDEMFKLVSEALPSDKIVKVKGLGTFKIIEVHDRESVNVNTGERVVIEGHGKVSFTPDNSMKDLVNKPFSQFDTVILNDDVDFTEIDSKEEDAAILADINDDSESLETEILSESESESENISENNQEIKIQTEEESQPIIDQPLETIKDTNTILGEKLENDKKPEPELGTEVVQEKVRQSELPLIKKDKFEPLSELPQIVDPKLLNISEPVGNSKSEKEPLMDNGFVNEVEKNVSEDLDLLEEPEKSSHIFLKVLFSVFIALIIFGGGFYVGQYLSANGIYNVLEFGKIEKPIAPHTKKTICRATVKAMPKKEPKVDFKSDVNSSAKHNINQDNKVKEASKSADAKNEDAQSLTYDNKNAQVRTGAYRIIGVDKVITLKSDESVKNISDRMLGPGMECYISVLNDINGTKTLNKGQKIKIPKLELRHHKAH